MAHVVQACRDIAEHMQVQKQLTGAVDLGEAAQRFKTVVAAAYNLELTDVTAIMAMMNGTDLPLQDRKDITDALKSKMSPPGSQRRPGQRSNSGGQAGGRQISQNCPTFARYMTSAMWELWTSPQCTFQRALESLAKRCDEMGLVSPSETCKRDIWCVWVACRTPPGMRPVEDAAECLRQKE
eukprot:8524375-Pyramimonas_sp.AAC.1